MENLFKKLTEEPIFNTYDLLADDYLIETGLTFTDSTPFNLAILQRKDNSILTDSGRTIKNCDLYYDLTQFDILNVIRTLTELTNAVFEKGKLTSEVKSVEDFIDNFLTMVLTSDFLDQMRIFMDYERE